MAAQQTMKKHLSHRSIHHNNKSPDPPPGAYAPGTGPADLVPPVMSAATAAPAVTEASGGMNLIGVNISGGEYGPTGSGTLNFDYTYPSASEISYYASKGMTVIRVPFQLERLEPTANGPLNASQVADLQQVISTAAASGLKVILDPHNYGSAWGTLIGSTPASLTSYANFWGQMATAFKGDPNVLFGLMNEPYQQSPQEWAQADNAAIASIRQAGAAQEILVPGTDWTGAWSWISSGNAAAINPTTIVDPLHNYAFEVHQYLDSDGSGTNYGPITNPNIGVSRLTAITQWAEQNGAKLFLGELGVPSNSQSLTAMQNMLTYMEQNSSAWQGATYWAGGAWLGSYPFSIEPQNGHDAPQMTVLKQFAPGGDLATGYVPPDTLTPDTLVLTLSEDAWNGNANFIVDVNGTKVGSGTVTALQKSGQTQNFSFSGQWGPNATVAVDFTNDAYGGSATKDRNLYVDQIAYDGQKGLTSVAPLYSNGAVTVAFPHSQA